LDLTGCFHRIVAVSTGLVRDLTIRARDPYQQSR
jgi:hypothetical protein